MSNTTSDAPEGREADPQNAAESDAVMVDTTLMNSASSEAPPPDTALSDAKPFNTGSAATESPPGQSAPRPRIRWGAIVWGLIVCGIAAATLQVTRTAGGREAFMLWLSRLTPGALWLIAVLLTGAILLVLGLLATIRRTQRST